MKIKLIDYGAKEKGLEPVRAHYNDAGADVFLSKTFTMGPLATSSVPLGFGVEIPDGYVGFIFPRSSLARKGIDCKLPPIDSGYRGEIHAVLTNNDDMAVTLNAGDRIGQLVILPVVLADFTYDLGPKRNTGAFGSTGR